MPATDTVSSATDHVADTLRRQIVTGTLPAGVRLHQAALAADFDVSRIPVRDALHVLSGEGLVRLNGRAGATVTPLSIADLEELYELRQAVEPLVSRLGVAHAGRAQVLRMRELQAGMEAGPGALAWLAANNAFHRTIYERADRPRTVALVENLRRQTDRYVHLHLEVIGKTDHLHSEHRAILDALERSDAEAVARLTREHLRTAHDVILEYLLEVGT